MSNRGGARPGAGRKPGSRNKVTTKQKATITEIALKQAPDALKVLAQIMNDIASPAAARVSAANAILDRACGKVQVAPEDDADEPQSLSVSISVSPAVGDVRVTKPSG